MYSTECSTFAPTRVPGTARYADALRRCAGPVSIAFQVAHDFQDYKDGVYDGTCEQSPSSVNHAVVAVGYGETTKKGNAPYWIVRNSWGTDWGMDGYFQIARGKNKCGLADCASFPLV